eukprot:EG_transcript_23550
MVFLNTQFRATTDQISQGFKEIVHFKFSFFLQDTCQILMNCRNLAVEVTDKGKQCRKWVRGAKATPESRASQFPGVMEVRGNLLWCTYCDISLGFKEKCTAANHVKCAKHLKNVAKKPRVVKNPGLKTFWVFFKIILCLGPASDKRIAEDAESQPTRKKSKTVDLKDILQNQR